MSDKEDAKEGAAELKKLSEVLDKALPGGIKGKKKGWQSQPELGSW